MISENFDPKKPTMSDNVFLIMSNFLGPFRTPLSSLKLDVILGCSLDFFVNVRFDNDVLNQNPMIKKHSIASKITSLIETSNTRE